MNHLPLLSFDVMLCLLNGPKFGYTIRKEVSDLYNAPCSYTIGALGAQTVHLKNIGMIQICPSTDADPFNTDELCKYYELTEQGFESIRDEIVRRQEVQQKAQARLEKALERRDERLGLVED